MEERAFGKIFNSETIEPLLRATFLNGLELIQGCLITSGSAALQLANYGLPDILDRQHLQTIFPLPGPG
jgi:hypothetical protein